MRLKRPPLSMFYSSSHCVILTVNKSTASITESSVWCASTLVHKKILLKAFSVFVTDKVVCHISCRQASFLESWILLPCECRRQTQTNSIVRDGETDCAVHWKHNCGACPCFFAGWTGRWKWLCCGPLPSNVCCCVCQFASHTTYERSLHFWWYFCQKLCKRNAKVDANRRRMPTTEYRKSPMILRLRLLLVLPA